MSSTRADRGIEDVWPGLRLRMVMHVGDSGGSRAWQGLLGRRSEWGPAHRGQRVSAKDPQSRRLVNRKKATGHGRIADVPELPPRTDACLQPRARTPASLARLLGAVLAATWPA